jgi:uncharacterized protein YjiS (DUF1127 family)
MSDDMKLSTRSSAFTGVWTLEETDVERDQAHLRRLRPNDFDLAEFYCDDVRRTGDSQVARPRVAVKRRVQFRDIAARLTPELMAPVKTIFPAIKRWREGRRNAAILYALDDVVLKDIGICRCAIEYVVQERSGGSGRA